MSNQSSVIQSIADNLGVAPTHYESMWHQLWDNEGIASGFFEERMVLWLQGQLGSSETDISSLQAAYAVSQGFDRWDSITALTLYSPVSLFASNEEGAFYDFSNLANLRQNSDGTGAVSLYGDPVGYVEDQSGNGNNLTQPTSTARPLLARVPVGGRRNMVPISIDSSSLTAFGSVPTYADGQPDALGGSEGVLVSPPGGSLTLIEIMTFPSEDVVFTIYAKSGTSNNKQFIIRDQTTATNIRTVDVNLVTGASSASHPGSTTVEAVDDGFYRIELRATGMTIGNSLWLYLGSSSSRTLGDTWTISNWQLEPGTSSTAYQRVAAAYDITEAGVDSVIYPLDDTVDDALTVSMPDLGTDATRAVVNQDLSVTYLENQTIGAGNIDIPLDKAAVIYIDRDLTAGEKSDLEAWAAGLGQ